MCSSDLADDRLQFSTFDEGEGFIPGLDGFTIEDDLSDPVVISQIDEEEIAMVSLDVDPSGEFHGLADMAGPQLSAVMRTVSMHR